jgi:hypothetical protein
MLLYRTHEARGVVGPLSLGLLDEIRNGDHYILRDVL